MKNKQRYAQMLSEKTGLPAYTLKETDKKLEKSADIIYMGRLMTSAVKGYKDAVKKYQVKALCGVGLGPIGYQI